MGWQKGKPSSRKGKSMKEVLGDRYESWKAKNDIIRPRGVPLLTEEQEIKRRIRISEARTGIKHNVISPLKGKTFIDIHGEEKAEERKKRASDVRKGISSGMKGKIAWNKGRKSTLEERKALSQLRLNSVFDGKFDPQKSRFKSKSLFLETEKGGKIYCQGSWEPIFAKFLDSNPDVLDFQKDAIRIRYIYDGRERIYITDFFIQLKNGKFLLVEIKPRALLYRKENPSKFLAAIEWCKTNNAEFILVTEKQIEQMKRGQQ